MGYKERMSREPGNVSFNEPEKKEDKTDKRAGGIVVPDGVVAKAQVEMDILREANIYNEMEKVYRAKKESEYTEWATGILHPPKNEDKSQPPKRKRGSGINHIRRKVDKLIATFGLAIPLLVGGKVAEAKNVESEGIVHKVVPPIGEAADNSDGNNGREDAGSISDFVTFPYAVPETGVPPLPAPIPNGSNESTAVTLSDHLRDISGNTSEKPAQQETQVQFLEHFVLSEDTIARILVLFNSGVVDQSKLLSTIPEEGFAFSGADTLWVSTFESIFAGSENDALRETVMQWLSFVRSTNESAAKEKLGNAVEIIVFISSEGKAVPYLKFNLNVSTPNGLIKKGSVLAIEASLAPMLEGSRIAVLDVGRLLENRQVAEALGLTSENADQEVLVEIIEINGDTYIYQVSRSIRLGGGSFTFQLPGEASGNPIRKTPEPKKLESAKPVPEAGSNPWEKYDVSKEKYTETKRIIDAKIPSEILNSQDYEFDYSIFGYRSIVDGTLFRPMMGTVEEGGSYTKDDLKKGEKISEIDRITFKRGDTSVTVVLEAQQGSRYSGIRFQDFGKLGITAEQVAEAYFGQDIYKGLKDRSVTLRIQLMQDYVPQTENGLNDRWEGPEANGFLRRTDYSGWISKIQENVYLARMSINSNIPDKVRQGKTYPSKSIQAASFELMLNEFIAYMSDNSQYGSLQKALETTNATYKTRWALFDVLSIPRTEINWLFGWE